MTSEHVSISPPSVPCHQATISLAWSKNVQCPMAASLHAFSSHLLFPLGLFFSFFLGLILFLFFFNFSGKDGWRGLNPRCVCVMLPTVPAATCSLWPTAPPHILLLHVSGHPPSSAGSPQHLCLMSATALQYERAGLGYHSQNEQQLKPTYCTAIKEVNLLFYSIFMWNFTISLYCFSQLRATGALYSDSSHIKCL